MGECYSATTGDTAVVLPNGSKLFSAVLTQAYIYAFSVVPYGAKLCVMMRLEKEKAERKTRLEKFDYSFAIS